MTRLVAYRPSSLQLQTLQQLANVLELSLETTSSIDTVKSAIHAESSLCIVACDQAEGAEAVEFCQNLQEYNLLVYILCPQPTVGMAFLAGRACAQCVFDHTFSPESIADVIRKSLSAERQNCEIRAICAAFKKNLQLLSSVEKEVLGWVLYGEPNKMIARRLRVSQRTIEARRQKVFKKLKVRSLAALVRSICQYVDIETLMPCGDGQAAMIEDDAESTSVHF